MKIPIICIIVLLLVMAAMVAYELHVENDNAPLPSTTPSQAPSSQYDLH